MKSNRINLFCLLLISWAEKGPGNTEQRPRKGTENSKIRYQEREQKLAKRPGNTDQRPGKGTEIRKKTREQ